ncbi:phosphatidylserine decarboxylase proenzyme 2-like [Gossypium australe]|uniref:Phosphatidylserine decarboxylase proenzyme 2-like n=1 Tax=Gossypium australe TaxID=47621 RepID=A0A5B6V1K5_9ROSI|nr:phosphatidylserine decarboxylase proenzyme 2-like [Gossypium australe]
MGHGSSKEDGSSSSSDEDAKPSRISRVKQRLRRHRLRRRRRSDSSHKKLLAAEDFAGVAHLTLINVFLIHRLLIYSLLTDKPVWNCLTTSSLDRRENFFWKKLDLVLPESQYLRCTNRLSKNNLIGYCEINLLDYLTQDSESDIGTFDLIDPGSSDKVVGCVRISCNVEDPIETEKNFARRILSIVDYDEDGKLSLSEFSELINAFGNNLAASKKEELFKAADKNGDGVVSMDELAELLALQQET